MVSYAYCKWVKLTLPLPTSTLEISPLKQASLIINFKDSTTILNKNEEIGSPYLNPLWILNGSHGEPFIIIEIDALETHQ